MNLRKTIDGSRGVYRIFELASGAFHVLDSEGRTVDEFNLVASERCNGRVSVKRDLVHQHLQPGVPDLASDFASDVNDAHPQH